VKATLASERKLREHREEELESLRAEHYDKGDELEPVEKPRKVDATKAARRKRKSPSPLPQPSSGAEKEEEDNEEEQEVIPKPKARKPPPPAAKATSKQSKPTTAASRGTTKRRVKAPSPPPVDSDSGSESDNEEAPPPPASKPKKRQALPDFEPDSGEELPEPFEPAAELEPESLVDSADVKKRAKAIFGGSASASAVSEVVDNTDDGDSSVEAVTDKKAKRSDDQEKKKKTAASKTSTKTAVKRPRDNDDSDAPLGHAKASGVAVPAAMPVSSVESSVEGGEPPAKKKKLKLFAQKKPFAWDSLAVRFVSLP
jgi:hypothetical protein